MRLFAVLPLFAVVMVGMVGCATPPPMSPEDALVLARSVVGLQEAAVAAKDAAALANLYVPDGMFQNAVGVYKGRDAIQKYREAGFKAGIFKEEISVTDVTVVGDMLYDVGEFTIHLNTEAGPSELKGRWGGTLVRTDGDWKIGLVTISMAPLPTSAPAAKPQRVSASRCKRPRCRTASVETRR
jgi:uncharacterized protein (TIGR02246 family)